jgi:hypothetical protein
MTGVRAVAAAAINRVKVRIRLTPIHQANFSPKLDDSQMNGKKAAIVPLG